MNSRAALLSRIESHLTLTGLGERDFGYAAVQDGRFVGRLRNGAVTLKVIERAEAYLDGIAPDARTLSRKRDTSARSAA